jgi:hypothetical protein
LLTVFTTTSFCQNLLKNYSNNLKETQVSGTALTDVFLNNYQLSLTTDFSIVYPTQTDTFLVGEKINPIITLPTDIIISPIIPSIADWYTEYTIDDGATWIKADKLNSYSFGIEFTIPAEVTDQCKLKVTLEYYNEPSTTVTKSAISEPFTIIKPEGDWELFTGTIAETCKKVNEFAEDSDNNIWAATGEFSNSNPYEYSSGLLKYDGTDWNIYDTTNSPLPSNYISSVCIDSSGNIWIGTWPTVNESTLEETGGLVKFDGTNWTVYDLDNSDLPSLWISHVETDHNGDIWVASSNEHPLATTSDIVYHISKFDGTNNWEVTDNSTVTALSYVTDIEFDNNGNMWLATGVSDLIYALALGDQANGIIKYDGSSWEVYKTSNCDLSGNSVFDLEFDSNGDLFVSSYDSDGSITGTSLLQKFDGSQWSEVYSPTISTVAGISISIEILGKIQFDNNQNLLFSSLCMSMDGSGNYQFTSKLYYFSDTDSIFYTSTNSDIPEGVVQAIGIDHNGHRWLGTIEMDFGSSFTYNDSHIAMLQLDDDTNNDPNPPNIGEVIFTIGSETTFNGAMVTVPVNLQLGTETSIEPYTLSGKLRYDNSKLSFNSASSGSAGILNSSNWSCTGYSTIPGEIDFILSGYTPIAEDGLMFQINFTVADQNPGSTEVYGNISEWKLNYTSSIVTEINSGTITYTAPSGESTLRGDASMDFKVDAEDITVITNHLYLGTALSAQAKINADADLDGSVTLNDATAIALYIGLGSWSTGTALLPATSSSVSIPTVEYPSDNLILLPIEINKAENVRSFNLFVEYDPEQITFQNFSTNLKEDEGFYINAAEISPGKTQFSFCSAQLVNQEFELGKIALKGCDDSIPTGTTIKTEYKVNDGETKNGQEITLEITGIKDEGSNVIENYQLFQNYPNPFNPTTTIKFALPSSSQGGARVRLVVYNSLGQQVATLVDEQKAPGFYEIKFDGSNLSSGIYFYKLTCDNFTQTKKLLLLK